MKFCEYKHKKEGPQTVTDKNGYIEIAKTAAKTVTRPGQTTRVRSTKTNTNPKKRKADVVKGLDDAFVAEIKAKMAKTQNCHSYGKIGDAFVEQIRDTMSKK